MRGYTAGQYLDRWMVAAQAEGRWRSANRWIATGFAGIGVVEPALPRRAEKDSLPAAGVGMLRSNFQTLMRDHQITTPKSAEQ